MAMMKRVYKCIKCGARRCGKAKQLCDVCKGGCSSESDCNCNELAKQGIN